MYPMTAVDKVKSERAMIGAKTPILSSSILWPKNMNEDTATIYIRAASALRKGFFVTFLLYQSKDWF